MQARERQRSVRLNLTTCVCFSPPLRADAVLGGPRVPDRDRIGTDHDFTDERSHNRARPGTTCPVAADENPTETVHTPVHTFLRRTGTPRDTWKRVCP